MTTAPQLFYNLLTRDALLVHNGVAHPLEGPFDSREEAERAAEELIGRLDGHDLPAENRPGFAPSASALPATKGDGWMHRRFEGHPSPR